MTGPRVLVELRISIANRSPLLTPRCGFLSSRHCRAGTRIEIPGDCRGSMPSAFARRCRIWRCPPLPLRDGLTWLSLRSSVGTSALPSVMAAASHGRRPAPCPAAVPRIAFVPGEIARLGRNCPSHSLSSCFLHATRHMMSRDGLCRDLARFGRLAPEGSAPS